MRRSKRTAVDNWATLFDCLPSSIRRRFQGFFVLLMVMVVMLVVGILFPTAAHARMSFPFDFQGKVIYVDDGDTLIMLDPANRQHNIRLTDVDAPEVAHPKYGKLGQPFSKASGRNLANLAKGKVADAHCYEFDDHSRLVCRVVVAGMDVSLAQIRAGMGWANVAAGTRYVRDARAYDYQAEAKRERRGLWSDASPVAPWVWRRNCWKQGLCTGADE